MQHFDFGQNLENHFPKGKVEVLRRETDLHTSRNGGPKKMFDLWRGIQKVLQLAKGVGVKKVCRQKFSTAQRPSPPHQSISEHSLTRHLKKIQQVNLCDPLARWQ